MRRVFLVLFILLLAGPAAAEPYVDPHGFSIDVPAGFTAHPMPGDKARGIRVESAQHDSAGIMFADIPQSTTPQNMADFLCQAAVAHATQVKLVSQHTESTSPYVEVRQYDMASKGAMMRAGLLVYSTGRNITMYMIMSPHDRYAHEKSQLVGILQSFRYVAQQQFVDPHEQAFSVSLPADWSVSGGTLRKSSFEANHQIVAMSAGHDGFVLAWDPYPQTFVAPNPALARAGFREGSVFSPGYGVQETVLRPLSPSGVLRWLAARDKYFNGIEAGQEHPVPAMSGTAIVDGTRVSQQSAWVDVNFSASKQHGQALVQVTQTFGYQDIWFVTVSMWTAAPGHETAALDAYDLAQRTFRKDPQWVAREAAASAQRGADAAAAQPRPALTQPQPYNNGIQAANEKINQMRMGSYHYQQAVADHVAQMQHDTTTGTQRMRNPSSGQTVVVPSGSNYYYQLPAGTQPAAGTNSGRPPGPNMVQLERLP